MTLIVEIAESTYVRRQCRVEARILASNSMTSRQQQYLYMASGRRHPRVQSIVRPRFKRQFMAPMPQQRRTSSSPEDVQNRSLCPWDDVLDVDITRIPNNMYKAVCHDDNENNRCDFSFSRLMRDNHLLLGFLSLETECAVVYSQINVQFECCEEGRYSIREEWIDWPVACTCARKRVRTGLTAT